MVYFTFVSLQRYFALHLSKLRRTTWRALHIVTLLSLITPGVGDALAMTTARDAHESFKAGSSFLASTPWETRFSHAPVGTDLQYSPVMFIENVGQYPTPAGVSADAGPRFQVHGAGGTIYLAPNALWITLLEPVEADSLGRGKHEDLFPTPTAEASATLEASPTSEASATASTEPSITPESSTTTTAEASATLEASPITEASLTAEANPTLETTITSEPSATAMAEPSATDEASLTPDISDTATTEANPSPETGSTLESSATPELSPTAESSTTLEPSITSEASATPGELTTPKPHKQNNFRLSFVGANPHPQIVGFDRLDTKISYFIGNDSTKWHADVPVWAGVRYVDFYPGLDLEITSDEGEWQWRLVARRGNGRGQARLQDVRLQVDGAESLALAGKGLRLKSAVGDFELPLLQLVDDTGLPMSASAMEALGGTGVPGAIENQVTNPFAINMAGGSVANQSHGLRDMIMSHAQYPGTAPLLTADNPSALIYSTYLGANSSDNGEGIAVDANGSVYVVGSTQSNPFPTKPEQADPDGNYWDAFVSKLNANGSGLIYSAYLGYSGDDYGNDIAVDASRAAYIAWSTSSTAKVTKLSATGTAVVYSYSFSIGGSSYGVSASGIALDKNGQAYVVGSAGSAFVPTTGAAQEAYSGNGDAFVTKLNASGSAQVYATYFGGTSDDYGYAIAVDTSGAAYITGQTASTDVVTTTGTFQLSHHGGYDVFVAKLNAAGSAWVYSTYLGGSAADRGYGIAVDNNGSAYITGEANSYWDGANQIEDFPLKDAYQPHNGDYDTEFGCRSSIIFGCHDAFVTKLLPDGSNLVYSTYLGGPGEDYAFDIALDATGAAYVTGNTASSNFPTRPGAYEYDSGCTWCGSFLSKFNPTGSQLPYSSYGGGNSLAVNGQAVYLTGSAGDGLPTTVGAYDQYYNGGGSDPDAFIAEFRTSSGIPPQSVLSPPSGDGSKFGPAATGGDPRECGCSTLPGTQGFGGDPINTQTGGFAFSAVDLSVPTVAGPLVFQRTYASTITNTTIYTTTLGPAGRTTRTPA